MLTKLSFLMQMSFNGKNIIELIQNIFFFNNRQNCKISDILFKTSTKNKKNLEYAKIFFL